MNIIRTENGFGVEHEGALIVRDESMGVCDSVIFAHSIHPRQYSDFTEGREIIDSMERKRKMEKAYLGDSVYAQFDGNGMVLTTENGMPGDPSNTIYVELSVFQSLIRMAKRCYGEETFA